MNDEQFVGEKDRPYRQVPPEFGKDGLPWGAYCQCSRCGYVGRSTGLFDYYNDDGELVCGECLGHDQLQLDSVMCTRIAAGEFECDPLGPGCRGGYSDDLAEGRD